MIRFAHHRCFCAIRSATLGVLCTYSVALARADALKMPNGETLQGTIVRESAESVVFHSASFGEIKVSRVPGMEVLHGDSAAPAVGRAVPAPTATTAAAAAPAPAHGRGGPGAEPPGVFQKLFGLSDRWSFELDANLMVQNDKFHASANGTEVTIGYRVPNPTKPMQPRHEYGLFGAYNFQKVDATVVGENSELAFRYFYQPLSRWLLVSQADWIVDRINNIASRSHALAIPSYRFVDTPRTRLLAGVGPSFLTDTRLIPTESTTAQQTVSGFRVGFYELFVQTISPALKFQQTLVVLSRMKDPSTTYNLRIEASLQRQLSAHLMLNLGYDYVRDENTVFAPESITTLKLMLGYHF